MQKLINLKTEPWVKLCVTEPQNGYNNIKSNQAHAIGVIDLNTSVSSGRGIRKKAKLKTPNVERVKMCDH